MSEVNEYEKADVDLINCFEDEEEIINKYKKRGVDDYFMNTSKEEKVDNKIKFNTEDNIEVRLNDMFIKPCPFCGSEAVLTHDIENGDEYSHKKGEKYSYIRCRMCGAKSKKAYMAFEYSSDQEVVKAWNKRAYEDD